VVGRPEIRDTHRAPLRASAAIPPHPAVQETSLSSFLDLGVPADLVTVLAQAAITSPTPIQTASLPATLAGRDLIGHAPTGSGKTVAFALPLVINAQRGGPNRPRALVLAPTRELASQIAQTLHPLAKARGLRVATFFGGTSLPRDVANLQRGVDIAVGCPGRLDDLRSRGVLDLSQTILVTLDEADRMADMGFLPVVSRLLGACSSKRQTLLFSATLDGDVARLIERFQTDPAVCAVEPDHVATVRHHFVSVSDAQRRDETVTLLREAVSAIVFVRTKRGADRLAKQLLADGVSAAPIHGNRSQPQRERALAAFASGQVVALIATDIAARGIHVDQVQLVVHYDLPAVHTDYVHRSGRTGRAGHDGTVVAFVRPDDAADAAALQRAVGLPLGTCKPHRALLTGAPGAQLLTTGQTTPRTRARSRARRTR
jgi:superfamily II DNA/RNA helicase